MWKLIHLYTNEHTFKSIIFEYIQILSLTLKKVKNKKIGYVKINKFIVLYMSLSTIK